MKKQQMKQNTDELIWLNIQTRYGMQMPTTCKKQTSFVCNY